MEVSQSKSEERWTKKEIRKSKIAWWTMLGLMSVLLFSYWFLFNRNDNSTNNPTADNWTCIEWKNETITLHNLNKCISYNTHYNCMGGDNYLWSTYNQTYAEEQHQEGYCDWIDVVSRCDDYEIYNITNNICVKEGLNCKERIHNFTFSNGDVWGVDVFGSQDNYDKDVSWCENYHFCDDDRAWNCRSFYANMDYTIDYQNVCEEYRSVG